MTNGALAYRILAGHVGVCVTCKRVIEAHKIEFPECGDVACDRIKGLCPRGEAKRQQYLDDLTLDD